MALDLIKKSDADLKKELAEKREALRAFRFAMAGSSNRNVREGRNTRRDIARYLTEMKRRMSA